MDERTESRIRDGLLAAGVKNLKEFGYPSCNKKNIMTDMVYRKFFLHMLEGEENDTKIANIETVRQSLIAELNKPTDAKP